MIEPGGAIFVDGALNFVGGDVALAALLLMGDVVAERRPKGFRFARCLRRVVPAPALGQRVRFAAIDQL